MMKNWTLEAKLFHPFLTCLPKTYFFPIKIIYLICQKKTLKRKKYDFQNGFDGGRF